MYAKATSLLFLSLIQLGASLPATLEDREAPCVALGHCPADLPPSSSTTSAPPAPTAAPTQSAFGCQHEADPDGAQGFCPAVAATGWCACSDSSTYAITTGDGAPAATLLLRHKAQQPL